MNAIHRYRCLTVRSIVLAVAVLVVAGSSVSAASVAEHVQYRSWDAIHVGNGLVDLWVVPSIGGRIIQVEIKGRPLFYLNDELAGKVLPQRDETGKPVPWLNYGGDKLWPAPQGPDDGSHWPGPPDPLFDGGKYQAEILSAGPHEAAVRLTSPKDVDRTGVQFIREIRLRDGETLVRSTTTMRNVVERPVRWSIWEVTQHDAGYDEPPYYNDQLAAYVPARKDSAHPRGFFIMYGDRRNPAWQRQRREDPVTVRFNYWVGKIGVDSDAGWLAVMNGLRGTAFAELFTYDPRATYTDRGSSVEFWINGSGDFTFLGERIVCKDDVKATPPLMESEVLSPWVALQPGEEFSAQVLWGLGLGQGRPTCANERGLVLAPAQAVAEGRTVSVEATVIPFVGGRIACVARDARGRDVGRRELAELVPGERKRVCVQMNAPGATSVELLLTDGQAKPLGTLASLPVGGAPD